jgi:hypothetical protein
MRGKTAFCEPLEIGQRSIWSARRFNLSSGGSRHHLSDFPQVDSSRKVHLPRVDLEDVQPDVSVIKLFSFVPYTGSL